MKRHRRWTGAGLLTGLLLLAAGAALADTARDLARGNVMLQLKSYAEAMDIFRLVTVAEPQNSEAWLGLGRAAEGAEKYDQAIAAYQRLQELSPPTTENMLRLAGVFIKGKRYAEAVPLYERICVSAPTIDNKISLAQAYARADRYNDALPLYKEAFAARPTDNALAIEYQRCQLAAERVAGEELMQKGDVEFRAGRLREAAEFYRQAQAAKNPPPDIDKKLLTVERRLLMQAAEIQLKKALASGESAGEEEVAEVAALLGQLEDFRRRNTEEFGSELSELQARLLLMRARQAMVARDYPAAQGDLAELVRLIDRDATLLPAAEQQEVWFLFAESSEKNGNDEQAMQYYQKVKFAAPAYPDIDDRIASAKFRRNLWLHIGGWLLVLIVGLTLAVTRRRWLPVVRRWWLVRAGNRAFAGGDWAEARRQYEAVRELPAPPAAVLARLTEVYQKLRMDEEAASSAEQATAGGGRDWNTAAALLQQRLAARDYPAAQAQLGEMQRLATTPGRQREFKELRLKVAEACGAWSDAAKAYAELSVGHAEVGAQRRQIELWIKAGAIDQATGALHEYVTRQPADWQWVAERLQELRRRFPESLRLVMLLGEMYEKQDERAAAISCYADILERVPQKEPLLRRLLVLHEQERDWEAVIRTGTQLVALAAPEPGMLLTMARAQQHRHDYPAAAAWYMKVLALEQDNVEAFRQLVEIGRYHAARDEQRIAVGIYRQLMDSALFDKVEVRFELGRSLFALGEYDEAIAQLQQVKRGSSQMRWQAKQVVAMCLLAKNMPDLALAQLDEIPVATPGFDAELRLEVLYQRGRAQEARGDQAAASGEYQKVVLSDLTYRDAAERLKRLGGRQ